MSELTLAKINNRWPLRLTEDRAEFHVERPDWEIEHLRSMHELLGEGDVVFDVGSECGDFSALFGTWGCEVVLVEPQPRYWPQARCLWEANVDRPPLATFVGFAADETQLFPPRTDAQVPFIRGHGWPAAADGPIEPDVGFRHLAQQARSTPCVRLDALATMYGAAPTALTIDVEGSEYRVLRGAELVLKACRPRIWLSVHGDQGWMDEFYPGEGIDAITEYLCGLGYSGERLGAHHEDHWIFT